MIAIPARDTLIVACAVSAGIHAALAPAHLAEGAGAAIGFLGAAAVLAALAVRLTIGPPSAAATGAAAAVFAGLIASYVLTVTSGVPVLHPEREAVEGLALLTKAVEAAGLLAARSLVRQRSDTERPIPLALTALVAVFSALAALAASGGHEPHVHAAGVAWS